MAETISESESQCYPKNDEEFLKQVQDTSFLEKFVDENKWRQSCASDPNFSMLEVLLYAKTEKLEAAVLYLQRRSKEYPDDPFINANLGLYSMEKLIQEGESQQAYDGLVALRKDFPNGLNILKVI